MSRLPARVLLAAALAVLAGCPSATTSAAAPTPAPPAPAPAPAPVEAAPADDEDLMLLTMDFGDDAAPAPGSRPLLVLGMARPIGAQAAIFSAKSLNTHLAGVLGGEVKTRLFDDADVLGEALAAGAIDIAWLTPPAYVRAAARAAVKPIVRLSRGGYTSYRSVLFVKAASTAKQLEDLKGGSIVWIGPGSASGGLFPKAHLRKLGLDLDTWFGAQSEAPDHREACLAVLEGRADAGATLSDVRPAGEAPVVDGCRAAGLDPTQFRIVANTGEIPNDVLASRADLDADFEAKVKDAFVAMATTEPGRAELRKAFNADGFADVNEDDFEAVRALDLAR